MDTDRARRFWRKFYSELATYGIPPHHRPMCQQHVQRYIDAHEGLRLVRHGPRQVSAYLEKLGRSTACTEYTYAQVVRALEILFRRLVKAPWADRFSWEDWLQRGRVIPANHATVVRDRLGVVSEEATGQGLDPDTLTGAVARAHALAPELIERLVGAIRMRDYSIRTEEAYLSWFARFMLFHDSLGPDSWEATHVRAFLEHLVLKRKVSASTQKQALNALAFVFRHVLGRQFDLDTFARSRKPVRVPVVLSRDEVRRVLDAITATTYRLMADLLYGCGLRLMEVVRLRVQDVDFERHRIVIREAKGRKDRVVPLPRRLVEPLARQIEQVRALHARDLDAGHGEVYLPEALARKYPQAPRELRWQYLFPSARLSHDPRSGRVRRHHLHENSLQKQIRRAANASGIVKRVTSHTFRHSFATHLLESGTDIRTVQELLGHADVNTTMIYTHVLDRPGVMVASPLDSLDPAG